MKKYLHLSALFLLVLLMSLVAALPSRTIEAATTYSATIQSTYDYPTWISAPSIKLSSPIQKVGVTKSGDLAVPSGHTNNVGWYKSGVKPGEAGTAVLDAHVFAAFKNLSKIKPGGHIYITMASGKVLDYMVTASNLYQTKNLSPYALFTPTSIQALNLITCAGTYVPSTGTYDHRIIVSAQEV